jgi:putative membrane protein insertion efficiency factor
MEIIRGFRPVTWLAIGFVKAWRLLLSPLYGDVCKYRPTCSAYGLRALQVHGVVRATPLIVWRILRCNPWSNGGYDPVPGTPEAREWAERQARRAAERQDDAEQDSAVEQTSPVEQTGAAASSPDEPDAQLNDQSRASRSGKYPRDAALPAQAAVEPYIR